MGNWQNLENAFFEEVTGEYDFPIIEPVYELPRVNRFIEFDYCYRVRDDQKTLGVHFFEPDRKFERCWSKPNRAGEMLKKFGYLLGPDFSVYSDFPKAMQIYNHYRNNWLVRYWQICYNIIIVPTVLWGEKDTFSWCFDGYPTNSIVAVSNVGNTQNKEKKEFFRAGYDAMLERLHPSKIIVYSRNFEKLPGNVEYVRYIVQKGDQIDGDRTT